MTRHSKIKTRNIPLILFLLLLTSTVHFSWAQQNATQTIKGTITDEASKSPLPGVNIVLLNSSTTLGAATDVNGFFKVEKVPLGRQSFQITFIGYETVVLNDIIVTSGKEVNLNITIREDIKALNEVVVEYNRAKDKKVTNNDMLSVSGRPFNMDESKRYAGSLGDPARMAANFAGVVSTNDTRNDIIIRGNSPNSMLWQLDGLNIPNPNHFGALNSSGGSVSMLNNNNIDKSDFITSAFPAQYGNALAGVFDIKLREGNNEKHEFVAQMGFNGFEAGAEGPIGKPGKASYLVNARYSTLALFQEVGLSFGTGSATPVYYDLNYKMNTPVGKKGAFSVFGIWGQSEIDILGKDYDSTGNQAYGNAYSNRFPRYATNITGVSYQHRLSSNTTARLTLGYSRTDEEFNRDSLSSDDINIATPDWYWNFLTEKYSGVFTVNHKFNAKHSMVFGLIEDFTSYSIFNKRIYGGVRDFIIADKDGELSLTQAYAQWKYRISTKWSLFTGLHYQYLDLSSSQSLEPRLGIKYMLSPQHTFGFGYGLHSQIENLLTYSAVTNTPAGKVYTNESLGFSRSQHFVLSHDWSITGNTRIKTEVYFQNLYDIPVTRHPSAFSTINVGTENTPTIEDSLVNEGSGRNYGVEITVERSFDKGFYYLVSASLFDSKYKGSDGVERNTSYNMGNVLNVLAGREFKVGKKENTLGLSLKVSWVGGRYLSPIDYEKSVADGEAIYDLNRAFTEKQDDYFRADFKISYRKNYKKMSMELSLDLQNITNNENIFRQEWNSRERIVSNNYQQGFFPVPFIRFTF